MAKSKLGKDMLNKRYLGKEVRAPPKMKFGGATWDELEQCHNMFKAPLSVMVDQEYNLMQALHIAKVVMEIRNGVSEHGVSFSQNYIYLKGIKMFGEKGRKAAGKELDQLHQRNCHMPIDVKDLTPKEKAQAMGALMFLQEKKDGTMKGRMVYNGKPTREWLSREDSSMLEEEE